MSLTIDEALTSRYLVSDKLYQHISITIDCDRNKFISIKYGLNSNTWLDSLNVNHDYTEKKTRLSLCGNLYIYLHLIKCPHIEGQ